jgi:SNF2 family DNA or RNA helicase
MEQSDDYQEHGSNYLANNIHALLADDMGVGKSRQAVLACDKINAKRICIVCPSVARINWSREFEKWSPFDREFEILESKHDWPSGKSIIVSYNYAERYAGKRLCQFTWDVLILDEAHFVKSVNAKRSRAIWGVDGLVRWAKRIWALTGTPMPKDPSELWPMFYTFGWTKYNYDDFVQRYCSYYMHKGERVITGIKKENIGELEMSFRDRVLRRLKSEVITGLPEIRFEDVALKAKPIQFYEFEGFLEYYVPINREEDLREKITSQHKALESAFEQPRTRADKLNVLKNIATSMPVIRRYTGCLKVKPIIELVYEELMNNSYEKIVIFTVHRDVTKMIREGLKHFHAVAVYGGTDPARKQRNIDRFMKYPKYRVFVGNIHACGTAINLTSASEVLFAEQDWNPANNAQAMMRVYRRGQDKNVRVRVASLAETIDERVNYVLRKRIQEISEVYKQESYNLEKTALTIPDFTKENDSTTQTDKESEDD